MYGRTSISNALMMEWLMIAYWHANLIAFYWILMTWCNFRHDEEEENVPKIVHSLQIVQSKRFESIADHSNDSYCFLFEVNRHAQENHFHHFHFFSPLKCSLISDAMGRKGYRKRKEKQMKNEAESSIQRLRKSPIKIHNDCSANASCHVCHSMLYAPGTWAAKRFTL